MPCYHPIDAWHSAKGVFFSDTVDSKKIKLPCARCIGCRLERSRQWALRLMHEKRFHESTSFITLTYAKEHLPKSGSLDVKHFQDFMKRLRFDLTPQKIRFFHAGEYGEKRGRPHYHAIIFGHDFLKNTYEHETTERGDHTWRSRDLDRLWPHGSNSVGSVTFESCAYVARYITKKVTGHADWVDHKGNRRDGADKHYERICEVTGEIFKLKPEYCTMSRRPGIGAMHFEKFGHQIYRRDECVMSRPQGSYASKPPKFYDKQLEKTDPERYAIIKDQRECALSLAPNKDKTPRRLAEREIVKLAQLGSLKRKYELG